VTSDPAKANPELGAVSAPEREGKFGERSTLQLSVRGLDDMLAAVDRVVDGWAPPGPGEPRFETMIVAEDALLELGLDPSLFDALDLGGLHTFAGDLPHERYGHLPPEHIDLRVTLAVPDPNALFTSLPVDFRPSSTGPDSWRLADAEAELLFRAADGVLGVGTGPEQLDAAFAFRSQCAALPDDAPRVIVEISNPDPDNFDVRELLAELPAIDQQLVAILADEANYEFSFDFGTQRDLLASFAVLAPFGDNSAKVAPITGVTELAAVLPPDPLVVVQQALGERFAEVLTGMLEEVSDELPDQVAAQDPFVGLSDELILAAYADRKGRGTVVAAAKFADVDKARTDMREALRNIVANYQSPEYKISFAAEGLDLGHHKADLLTIELLADESVEFAKRNPWLFRSGKPKLECGILMREGASVIAFGAGQRETLRGVSKRLHKPSDDNLDGSGLALARSLTGGCHTCVSADVPALLDLILTLASQLPETSSEGRERVAKLHDVLAKLDLDGDIALAGRYDADAWRLSAGMSRSLLFAEGAALLELAELDLSPQELLSFGTPSARAACEHVLDIAKREAPADVPEPSAADIAKAIESCTADLEEEREERGKERYEELIECVMASDDMKAVMRCDESP